MWIGFDMMTGDTSKASTSVTFKVLDVTCSGFHNDSLDMSVYVGLLKTAAVCDIEAHELYGTRVQMNTNIQLYTRTNVFL